MQRSLMTKQHSKQFLLIRNHDVAIRHNIEAYLMMTCKINDKKSLKCVATTWIQNLKLKQNFRFMKQNTVS